MGIDFDDTTVETTSLMKADFECWFAGEFSSAVFNEGTTDPMLNAKFLAARWFYLRDVHNMPRLSLCAGVPEAFPILAQCMRLHINTARWEDQELALSELLEKEGLLKYIHAKHLRPIGLEDQLTVKSRVAKAVLMNYAAEDHGPLAINYAETGIKVALIDRPWNRRIPNSSNIRRYQELVDFAYDIVLHGSPKALFVAHRVEIEDPANCYKVHVVSRDLALSKLPEFTSKWETREAFQVT